MISQLLRIVRESIKAVPAMKYALAVAGLLAVVALVGAFKVSPQMAVLGALVTLVLMVAMVVFARLTTTAPRHFFLPAQIMMWAFLGLTIATACLLFTSAFFQWPRGLRELTAPQATERAAVAPPPVPVSVPAAQAEVRNRISVAQQQRAERDYPAAWKTIEAAVTQHPQSVEAHEEQVQVAMAWIRDSRVPESTTFTQMLAPLTECLRLNLDQARGNVPADIQAHLGWANFLRQSREQVAGLKVEDLFESAIAREAANPFAHAMWARVLADRRRPLFDLKPHFVLALSSGRERAYVLDMRVAALLIARTEEATLELLRVADEMRRKGDALDLALRKSILTELYFSFGRTDEAKVLKPLSPTDHLATFEWLLDGIDVKVSADYAYFQARLIEATGDDTKAAELYRELLEQDIARPERVRAGLARCEQRLKRKR